MLKNISLMAASTFARLISGSVLFVLIARSLGPEAYGSLVFCFSVAMFLVLILDFGHTTFLVREIGVLKSAAARLVGDSLACKSVLIVFFAVACLSCVLLGLIVAENVSVFVLFATSAVFAVMGDFFNLPFRGVESFGRETLNVVISSVVHVLLVGLVLWFSPDVVAIAASFAVSRFAYLALSFFAYRKFFGELRLPSDYWMSVRSNLKLSRSYAGDSGLVGLRGYADVFIVNGVLGPAALGVYQAGMNLVRAAENIAPILANVYLPRLAGLVNKPSDFILQNKNLTLLMLVAGAAMSSGFIFAPESVLMKVFGSSFGDAFGLFPFFGLFLFARFIAVSQGVVVTAMGYQRQRMVAGLLSLLLLVSSMFGLLHVQGVEGAVLASLLTAIFLAVYFSLLARKSGWHKGGVFFVIPLSLVLLSAAVFLLVVKS